MSRFVDTCGTCVPDEANGLWQGLAHVMQACVQRPYVSMHESYAHFMLRLEVSPSHGISTRTVQLLLDKLLDSSVIR